MSTTDAYIKNLAYSHVISLKKKCGRKLFYNRKKSIVKISRTYRYMKDIPERLVSLVPSVEWMIDNYYIISREAKVIKDSFSRRYCNQLPILKTGPLAGYPRIYSIAGEILKISDYHCEKDDIIRLLNEYQTVKTLTVGELWGFQNALKQNLIERICYVSAEIKDSLKIKQRIEKIIDDILVRASGNNDITTRIMSKFSREEITNPEYIAHILFQMKEQDIDDQRFKELTLNKIGGMDVSGIIAMESKQQALLQVKMSSVFTSLIKISTIDWENVFEETSALEKVLREDPMDIYARMDFITRDDYHHAIEKLARRLDVEEIEVAKKAVELCQKAQSTNNDNPVSHVGYYLKGRGINSLQDSFEYSPVLLRKLSRWVGRNKGLFYFLQLFIITAVVLYIIFKYTLINGSSIEELASIFVFLFILALTASIETVNYFTTHFSKPQRLPAMDFDEGIPDEFLTMVVMPVIIGSTRQVVNYTGSMETYYLANRDKNILFGILGDFRDYSAEKDEEDNEIIKFATQKINSLNLKYFMHKEEQFFFFCRSRRWNEAQKCWMGWERKRGKLEEFNRLIRGDKNTSYNIITGNRDRLKSIKYIITIDADTELTKDSARKLVAKMAHPLNRPVLGRNGEKVVEGYTIIQPRVGVRMHAAMATFFSGTFAGQAGINPYINAVSDIYQDNFREGIYAGKGIYNVEIFDRIMKGRIPENSVLSHDLLEGSYLRCGLASDIELMDGFPSTTTTFFKREHRWIRGDWQLLPWIFGRDRLNFMAKWKMLDNIRRSLLPLSQFVITAAAFTFLDWNFIVWLITVFYGTFFSLSVHIAGTVLLRISRNETGIMVSNYAKKTVMMIRQWLLLFILIPYRAIISVDAIIRTLYRLLLSHERMLEWQTAEYCEKNSKNSLYGYIREMWAGPFTGLLSLYMFTFEFNPLIMVAGILWISSPFAAWAASLKINRDPVTLRIFQRDEIMRIARKTWGYFEELFDEKDNWLSPDNYQLFPGNVAARRTSPTNIGFQLLAALCAYDLKFIDIENFIDRTERIFITLNKLEKWKGHLYNWYNTRTLEVLEPYYVSTVDSGNFIAYLIVLKKALEEAIDKNQELAYYIINRINNVIKNIDNLIDNTDFSPLYDKNRHLFRVGYNVTANSPDRSYYDLLASEARLTSLIAIARGDIPQKHWFKLGRPLTVIRGKAALLSWSGTMFEYLMPNIVMRLVPGTLLEQSCEGAVIKQMEYCKVRNVPWGISESGYYRFDMNLNYQYRAFGIPRMGFRSDLRKSLVISPYATVLALSIKPVKAYLNMLRLKTIGMEGKYGFYEAVDFISPRIHNKITASKYKMIYSYMVHHQGMSLAAINNFLNAQILVKRFHQDPFIKAVEILLEETGPNGIIIDNEKEKALPAGSYHEVKKGYQPMVVNIIRPKYPIAHVLSNNNYTVMVTSDGSGFCTCGNLYINRWRASYDRDMYGIFFYIRDISANRYWSAAWLPVMVEPDRYRVEFFPDRVEYTRQDGTTETKMEITVSPRDNAEIRKITLTNRSKHSSRIEVTSYFEPVLDRWEADLYHPAFSKLFIQTEFIQETNTLLAYRRPRKKDENRGYIFNTINVRGRLWGNIEYETDRSRFLGRGRNAANPQALHNDLPLSGTTGNVLDPVMSIRATVNILPGMSSVITCITGYTETREKALEMAKTFSREHMTEDVFKMALFDSEVEMQYLGITPKYVNAIQNLTGSIYYPSRLLRGSLEHIERNTLGQQALWKFGISGDYPIMLIRVGCMQHLNSLKDAVAAYEYMRKNGVMLDLVILNEENEDYFQPLNERILDIISNRKIYYPNSCKAAIFLLKSRNLNSQELNLLLCVPRIVLSDKNRLVSKRITKQLMEETAKTEADFITDRVEIYNDVPLDAEELLFFNGLGGFSQDGYEYIIMTGQDQNTPAPWSNIIANDHFGFLITASGGGYTWHINSRENKLTEWSNDPVTDSPSEILYLRDDITGDLFSPVPMPVKEKEPYRIRHGMGYTVFEHNSRGIGQKLYVYASEKDSVKVYRMVLKNYSSVKRSLSSCLYIKPVLGVSSELTAPFIVSEMVEDYELFTLTNSYNTEYEGQILFMSCSEKITSYTGDNAGFMGKNGSNERPSGLLKMELSNKTGAALDPCGVVMCHFEMEAGSSREIIFIMGQCRDIETAALMAEKYRRPQVATVVFNRQKALWRRMTSRIQVNTPDRAVNVLLNGWLIYQLSACRMKSRTAFYQCGGAFGFRDQLQDSLALLYCDPQITRQQILKCCEHQFLEGDVQHWWHDDSGRGVRTKISDDLLWLPYVVCRYIKATEDIALLNIEIPFLHGSPLDEEQQEKYFTPSVSGQAADVYEHCLRAIERACCYGEHGLPLMGSGDWNDGMNSVGEEGRGESVWLGWFLYRVLEDFFEICKMKNDDTRADRYKEEACRLSAVLDSNAWDGEWYLRAFFDNGEPLGSRQNNECRIDLIVQAWSVLSEAGKPEKTHKAMESLYKYLVKEEDKLIMLLTPPFNNSMPYPGYISGYLPGIRENGGQYTHAAVWAVMAYAKMGMGDAAYRLFNMINPITHALDYPEMMKYRQEPYVMSADVYSVMPHAGRGGWSWYTGSAGWMYQTGIQYILGLKKEGDKLHINPSIPKQWKHYSIIFRHGLAIYFIHVQNPEELNEGKVKIRLDGSELVEDYIPLRDDGIEHDVQVVMVSPEKLAVQENLKDTLRETLMI